MSPRGHQLALRLLADLEDLRELDRTEPCEVEALVTHVVAHLRSWRPESVSPLGTLPPPGEAIRDPRTPVSQRYPVIECSDGMRYTDWYSRTHDDLIARATQAGLVESGEIVRLGWVDRDSQTGASEYAWLDRDTRRAS